MFKTLFNCYNYHIFLKAIAQGCSVKKVMRMYSIMWKMAFGGWYGPFQMFFQHFLKKPLIENFIFCVVKAIAFFNINLKKQSKRFCYLFVSVLTDLKQSVLQQNSSTERYKKHNTCF